MEHADESWMCAEAGPELGVSTGRYDADRDAFVYPSGCEPDGVLGWMPLPHSARWVALLERCAEESVEMARKAAPPDHA